MERTETAKGEPNPQDHMPEQWFRGLLKSKPHPDRQLKEFFFSPMGQSQTDNSAEEKCPG